MEKEGNLVKKEVEIMSLLTKLPTMRIPQQTQTEDEEYFTYEGRDTYSYSKEIEKLKEKVSSAYANLDHVVDPLLIDSWIYEINAAQLRYQFCLQQLKNSPQTRNS